MATGGAPARKEEDLRHTCSMCLEPYRGRSPKLLPCFHTFCLPCLTALQDSVTTATREGRLGEENPATGDEEEKQPDSKRDDRAEKDPTEKGSAGGEGDVTKDGNDVTKDGTDVTSSHDDVGTVVILCPTCRTPVSIPEGGVVALQTNFYLDHEVSADEAPPPLLCDMCEEGNQQHAAHACQQCQLRMCRACRRCHDQLMRDHHVTPVSLGQPVRERSEKKGLCLVHQDQALCFHCRQCDVSICLHCKQTSHEGHVTVDLASAALQAKEEVTSLVTTAQQQLQVVESSLRRVDREERELTRHKQEVTQRVHARYDVLMMWANRSRDELLEEVSGKEGSARSQLRAEKTAAAVTMETLSALVSRAARVTGNDPDVVTLRNELRAALLSEGRLDRHRQQADRQEPLWGWSYDVTEASAVQPDIVQAYMGRVVEGGRDDVTSTLSLRELADKVDRLMNEMTQTNTNVTNKVDRLMNEMTQTNTNVTAMATNITAIATNITDNTANITDNTTNITSITSELSSCMGDVTTLTKKEAELMKATSTLQEQMGKSAKMVSFYARGLDETKSAKYKPLVFNNVTVNEGGCYDDTTGVFTTTVAGTYVFTATVMPAAGKSGGAEAYITVDGADYTCLLGSHTSSGSGSVSLQLGVGQKVWVKAGSDMDRYGSWWLCSFTGALVQPQL